MSTTLLMLVAAAAGAAVYVQASERWRHARLQMARLRFQREWEQRQRRLHGAPHP